MTLLAADHARIQHRLHDLETLARVAHALAQQDLTARDVGEPPRLGADAAALLECSEHAREARHGRR